MALGVGESSGGVEVVCVDGEGFAVDEGYHGLGAAGGGQVERFGGVGNGGADSLGLVHFGQHAAAVWRAGEGGLACAQSRTTQTPRPSLAPMAGGDWVLGGLTHQLFERNRLQFVIEER